MAPWDFERMYEEEEEIVRNTWTWAKHLSWTNMFWVLGVVSLYVSLVTASALYFSSSKFANKTKKKQRKTRAMFNERREMLGMSTTKDRRKTLIGKDK